MGNYSIGFASDRLGFNDAMMKYYAASMTFEEKASSEIGKTVIVISGSCYGYWSTGFKQKFDVYIDGAEAATSPVLGYGNGDNRWYTASASCELLIPVTAGEHTIAFVSSSSGETYEFTAELHPRIIVTLTKPEHTKSLVLHIGECLFESEKTMTESGFAYGGAEYSWEAVAEEGYELHPPKGSGMITGALVIAPEVMPLATVEIYSGGEWLRHFLLLFAGGEWRLYQAYVYSDGSWKKYY